MKKTLLLATHFPPAIGGTPTLYYNLCRHLSPEEIFVLTPKLPGWETFDAQQRFPIYRCDHCSHLDRSIFREIRCIRRISKQEQIDHLLFGHINFCLTSLLLKYVFGKNYYLYVHGEEITRDFGGDCYRFFKRHSLRGAKGIIVVSDYTKSLVEAYNRNVKVIYNAVDLNTFYPKPKSQELIRKYDLEDSPTLLTISRLEDRKGHDAVIRMLPRLLKTFPNIKYLIGGTGEEEERLKILSKRLHVDEHVRFLGEIPAHALNDYYNLCDVFVMPNRKMDDGNTEGFGIVFLEANACGKAVIGGNAGGVPSAIRDGYNGFLIPGENQDALYRATSRLLENHALRAQMGRHALAWVKNFTYPKLVENVREFLQ